MAEGQRGGMPARGQPGGSRRRQLAGWGMGGRAWKKTDGEERRRKMNENHTQKIRFGGVGGCGTNNQHNGSVWFSSARYYS